MTLLSRLVLLLTVLLIPACGGDAGDSVDLGLDVDERDEPLYGVLPYGTIPPELAGETVEKTFEASDLGVFDYHVASPGQYGIRGTSRCQINPASWDRPCDVPPYRYARVYIDLGTCGGAHPDLQNSMVDGYFYLEWQLRNEMGWDVARTYDPNVATIVLKCDPNLGVGGQAGHNVDFCWTLPAPNTNREVCFYRVTRGATARVGLVAIGDKTEWPMIWRRRFAFNVARHEVLHCLGWGHFPDADNLMNTDQPASFITEFTAAQKDWMRNYLMASHVSEPSYCNWQPGDPLGGICPHNVPAP